MEEYRRKLERRMRYYRAYCAFVLALTVLIRIWGRGDAATSFTVGAACGIETIVLFRLLGYRAALRDEGKLRKQYIEETDERNLLIQAKAGWLGTRVTLVTLAAAMLVAINFSRPVFFALLAAAVFVAAVNLALRAYYERKL